MRGTFLFLLPLALHASLLSRLLTPLCLLTSAPLLRAPGAARKARAASWDRVSGVFALGGLVSGAKAGGAVEPPTHTSLLWGCGQVRPERARRCGGCSGEAPKLSISRRLLGALQMGSYQPLSSPERPWRGDLGRKGPRAEALSRPAALTVPGASRIFGKSSRFRL